MSWEHMVLVYWGLAAAYLVFNEWREKNEMSLGDLIIVVIFGGLFAPMLLWEKLPARIVKITRTIASIEIMRARK